jgi:hypothetical protein
MPRSRGEFIARPASSAALTVDSVFEQLPDGLTNTATRLTTGTRPREFKSLCRQLGAEEVDTRQIAARPREAREETKPDGVFANQKNDGDRRGRSLRNPITGIVGCCARAATGHAAATPVPKSVMNSRRRIWHLVGGLSAMPAPSALGT